MEKKWCGHGRTGHTASVAPGKSDHVLLLYDSSSVLLNDTGGEWLYAVLRKLTKLLHTLQVTTTCGPGLDGPAKRVHQSIKERVSF